MHEEQNKITPIGKTDWRNTNIAFGIKDHDRLGHIYTIGKTGTGKSTLLLNMAISDIEKGKGFGIIDPHGDIAEAILNYIPESRIQDVIYFNATDFDYPIGFNPLFNVPPNAYYLVASGLVSTFKKIWNDSWGPRLEHILRFSILSLLHYPKAALLHIQPLLTDIYFRNGVLNYITDQGILNFWQNEFDKYPPALKSEAIAPILNKIGLFTASLPLRNIVGQQKCSFNMQQVLDQSKILICNFSKGRIGEEAAALLGAVILTSIQSAALSRASYPPERRVPFYLYVDEMHSFVTLSFADILAEARKYGLSLFLTNQYIEQIDERIRSAIFGNVGTLISFRVGAKDAEYLVKEFHPIFSEDDLVNLPKYAMYLKLMIDASTSKPFSAVTLPATSWTNSFSNQIILTSQRKYGRWKENVVQEIVSLHQSEVNKLF
jgi:type IV secretory system conjugative DNA transfer VirD4/TraG family protein